MNMEAAVLGHSPGNFPAIRTFRPVMKTMRILKEFVDSEIQKEKNSNMKSRKCIYGSLF